MNSRQFRDKLREDKKPLNNWGLLTIRHVMTVKSLTYDELFELCRNNKLDFDYIATEDRAYMFIRNNEKFKKYKKPDPLSFWDALILFTNQEIESHDRRRISHREVQDKPI